jgi:drug/metabolite transporter (DMT)-like permease
MLLAMALSGTIGLLVVESALPPLLVVFARCVLGALGLGLWLAWRREWVRPRGREWLWLAGGGVALVLNWVALFSAYHHSSIAVATVVYHVQPFLLLALSALQGERVERGKLPWLLLALLGVALSSGLLGTGGLQASHTGPGAWLGVALALLAASLYAGTTVATRRLAHMPPAQIAMLQMLAGGLLLSLWALPLWRCIADTQPGLLSARAGSLVLTLGLVHTAFMYTIMYAAFQRLAAPAIAALSFVYPAMALLVDLAWFGAVPSAAQWAGMACIVAAVAGHRLGLGWTRRA